MARVDKLYPEVGPWASLSRRLVRHYQLPAGTEFRRVRKGASSSRPTFRGDAEVRFAKFRAKDHPVTEMDRLSSIAARIEDMIAPHCRTEVIVIGPDKKLISKNTLLRTLQAMGPTQAELDEAETVEALRQDDIDAIKDSFEAWTFGIEHDVSVRDETLLPAIMSALVERFGADSIELELCKHF